MLYEYFPLQTLNDAKHWIHPNGDPHATNSVYANPTNRSK